MTSGKFLASKNIPIFLNLPLQIKCLAPMTVLLKFSLHF